MRLAQKRAVGDMWRQIGDLILTCQPGECTATASSMLDTLSVKL
jgi:hypothetical protein